MSTFLSIVHRQVKHLRWALFGVDNPALGNEHAKMKPSHCAKLDQSTCFMFHFATHGSSLVTRHEMVNRGAAAGANQCSVPLTL